MAKLPPRERHIVRLYYFGEATMKQIGEAIGVNESRVSQLHARAMQRLRSLMVAQPAAAKTAPAKPARPRLAHTAPRRRQIAATLARPAEHVQRRVA
jgi:DNA-binding CsgD family transcriptional regulator